LLKAYYKTQKDPKENSHMANKKKIEERIKAQQRRRTERLIQWIGGGVIALVVVGLIWFFARGGSNESETKQLEEVLTEAVPTREDVSVEEPAPQAALKTYDAVPPMTIDVTKKYLATFKMAKGGEFTVELYADKTPKTVNNFVFLARDGYYDGTTFHRVLEGFMAQGGDPTGTGMGGPGYQFEDEIVEDLKFDGEGILAMANAGPGTNGSQFFITYGPTEWLNGLHTIFGRVVEGMDVVKALTLRDPNQFPDYDGDVIEAIEIAEE
jgi:cyclophilin family peptidyl-prolyl cis-trans isomerase